MTARQAAVRTPPRALIRAFWLLHRAAYRATGGRFGLQRPAAGERFGTMRLTTVGRRSGKTRVAIIGYYEDGPNLVTLAMNGWGRAEPAWWLNLQANPETVVGLADGPRPVRARAATGAERDRLWARFAEFPGWGDDIDAVAARRSTETAVVVLEPRTDRGDVLPEAPAPSDVGHHQGTDPGSTAALAGQAGGGRRGRVRLRLRLRHLWIVPGLAIAVFANLQAEHLGLGIVPLLAFGIAPDVPRLLGLGQRHAHGQLPARAVPLFNLLHHPGGPVAMLGLAGAGVLPPALYVGALAWLGHLVVGLGIGDRLRTRDGYLRSHWVVDAGTTRPGHWEQPRESTSAEGTA